MNRRSWLGIVLIGGMLSSCSTTSNASKRTLESALNALPVLASEDEVVAELGSPTGVDRFRPGEQDDSYALNWIAREEWENFQVFVPPELIQELEVGSKILNYDFSYRPASTGGALLIYVGDGEKVLGWSYSRSLVGLEKKATLSRF